MPLTPIRMRPFLRFAVSLLASLCLGAGAKEAFPEKAITVIVPFAAGGGSDIFVRIFQEAIRKNQLCPFPIVVKNLAGAGGTIGSRAAKEAKPDGHTLLCLHDGIYTAQHYGNADWGPSDFEPLAATGRSGVVVAVSESSPFESLHDLMKEAIRRPYQYVFGTNLGAPNHYSALFLQEGMPWLATRIAISGLLESGKLKEDPIVDHLAAISVGVYNDRCVLDLDYPEDRDATVDANIVMTGSGQFVEVQSSGEEATFSRTQLNELLALAEKGVYELVDLQKAQLS